MPKKGPRACDCKWITRCAVQRASRRPQGDHPPLWQRHQRPGHTHNVMISTAAPLFGSRQHRLARRVVVGGSGEFFYWWRGEFWRRRASAAIATHTRPGPTASDLPHRAPRHWSMRKRKKKTAPAEQRISPCAVVECFSTHRPTIWPTHP